MALATGTQLGPYEVLSTIGAGGMGEVYRARDTRLGREVAVKVLPAAFAADADRMRRFEQEARAVGMLNHPNILIVHDIGAYDGAPYIVSELLEGETLRERLTDAALPVRKTIDYALQMARGLAAAHEKGVVHRDLKPENIFITKDGRVKILDFGLAKLTGMQKTEGGSRSEDAATLLQSAQSNPPSAIPSPQLTEPGMVMGTVGYMSPEQVRGRAADHRADIFAFGAILYEMLAGRRAFHGESAVEAMSAILKEEPPELAESNQLAPPALDQIVRRCLEKNPEARFQSASDLAFAIEALSGISTTAKVSAVKSGAVAVTPALAARRVPLWLAGVALFLVAAAAGFFAGKPFWTTPLPSYHRLTFRRGMIFNARFAPDGQTVVYSASWSGNPTETFSMRSQDRESPPLDLAKADLLSVSSTGEVAVLLNAQRVAWFVSRGTLARLPLGGGAPREVLEDVQQADFAPDGTKLAVVRHVGGRNRLEYPIGHVLYETTGWISHPRVSPTGDRIAFMDHQLQWDNRGWIAVVDMTGKKTTLTGEWSGQEGVAWTPDGSEIWFTASRAGEATALYAVTLSGRERVVARAPGFLVVHDISRDGRVLLSRGHISTGMIALSPDDARERDLSWLDFGSVRDLSADGKTFLFHQTGEGSGANYATYLRRTDGSPAVRLGDGSAAGLSPDGKWALTILHTPPQLVLLPTGAGEARQLERHGIEQYGGDASWFPDGKRIVFTGREPGRAMRCYVQDIGGGQPRAITPEGVIGTAVSPDGKFVVAGAENQKKSLYPVEGGEPQNISGLDDGDRIIRWSGDGRSLFVYRYGEVPAKIYRLDLSTGRKELLKEVVPFDPAGIVRPPSLFLTPDGKWCLYELTRFLSDLYVVEELK